MRPSLFWLSCIGWLDGVTGFVARPHLYTSSSSSRLLFRPNGEPDLQKKLEQEPFKSDDDILSTVQEETSRYSSAGFGDIMSSTTASRRRRRRDQRPFSGGLVTKSHALEERFGIRHPMDRMLVTANGNLQRLLASYWDAPVTVQVDDCHYETPFWYRAVQIQVSDQTVCWATSQTQVFDPNCQELVETGKVGLGQLFRYLDVMPEFELEQAGYNQDGTLFREYRLTCQALSCWIREDFASNLWNLHPDE